MRTLAAVLDVMELLYGFGREGIVIYIYIHIDGWMDESERWMDEWIDRPDLF